MPHVPPYCCHPNFSMFCSCCGTHLSAEAKFCNVCGESSESPNVNLVSAIKQENSTKKLSPCSSATPTGQTAVYFEQFRDKKAKERSSRFKPKKKKAKVENEEKSPCDARINVGLYRLREDELKFVRGSTLPLTVNATIGADELRKKAAEKIIKFNSDLTCDSFAFTLLYPDRTEVNTLPGSEECFTLKRYKEEIGKAYARLTFYVCKTSEFFDFKFRAFCSDESDGTEFPTLEQVCMVKVPISSSGILHIWNILRRNAIYPLGQKLHRLF